MYFATSAWHLYVARGLAGLSLGGTFIAIALFIGDVADNRVRGQLQSFISIFFNGGMLFAFVVGQYVDFYVFPLVAAGFPVGFLLVFTWLPDTPQSLMRQRKFNVSQLQHQSVLIIGVCFLQAAERSLRFYRNSYDLLDKNAEARIKDEYARLQQNVELARVAKTVQVSEYCEFASQIRCMSASAH